MAGSVRAASTHGLTIPLYGNQGDGGLDRVVTLILTRNPLPSNDDAERKLEYSS